MMLWALWYQLCNLRNLKSTHGGVILLVKLQVSASNITKSNTPPWVFFTYFKFHRWYQILQSISSMLRNFKMGEFYQLMCCQIIETYRKSRISNQEFMIKLYFC